MSSRSEASRQVRSSRLLAAGIFVATLVAVVICLSMFTWPRFASSGWIVGGLLVAGGVAGNNLMGGKGWPDVTNPASSVRTAIGETVVLAGLLLAAAVGL